MDRALLQRGAQTVRFVGRTYRTMHRLKAGRLTAREAGERLAGDVAAMGPLYIKMAQFVSARRDVVDAEFADALGTLHDAVPGEDPPPEVPGYDVLEPVGRASIATVFRGRRRSDGRVVAIKVRRPGVKESVLRDLPLLAGVMAVAAAAGLPGARNMREVVAECGPVLLAELDFRQEAAAQREFRRAARAAPWLVVPRVVEAGEDRMVSQFVPSRGLAEVAAPNPALATRLMDLYMVMLASGLVHADPHPGNMGVLPGGRVVLYDFGACLRVDPGTRDHVAGLLQAVLTRDADGVVRGLQAMGVLVAEPSQRLAARRLVRGALASPPDDLHARLAADPAFSSSSSDEKVVKFDRTFIYLSRTLALVDAACRRLDPGFSYDFSAWLSAAPASSVTGPVVGLLRDAAAVPSTMQTMQLDMEEFQMRIVAEIDAAKRAGTAAALLLALLALGRL